jgi:pilus assembly protein CpaF
MKTSSVFGQLQEFIENPEIEEIWINSPNRIFIAKQGHTHLTNLVLAESDSYFLE